MKSGYAAQRKQLILGRKACTDPKLGQGLSEQFLDWLQNGVEAGAEQGGCRAAIEASAPARPQGKGWK